ncbi:cyclase family protein [Fulvivirga sp. RKSG066]|uniref:cyclase family protein n=1 Tax=Fulvivirga aurantia TaxID=2529383 RepID=UPI0012BBEF8C|nr:cyclase family protein [Fulvivirga aurantia]MTI21520.1 cyclase family protein [Fulvivirga aurantia]
MVEIIDLSMDVYNGMPTYKGLPDVKIDVHATHEQWQGVTDTKNSTPSVYKLEMSEHTGTHVDALNHMTIANKGQSIDTMPLTTFYARGICLDLSDKTPQQLIEVGDLKAACDKDNLEIKPGDTVLIYTGHYRKYYDTPNWIKGPGLSAKATEWLGHQKIAAFGVETMAPGVSGISNKDVHRICGEMGFTHYENVINLHLLIGRGAFRFIGFPIKIKGGTGSPVRAVAIFE